MKYNVFNSYTIGNIHQKIEEAYYQTLDFEGYLLRNNIYEVSISHKFALYLLELFKGFNVDIEWNKTETGAPKTIDSKGLLAQIREVIKKSELRFGNKETNIDEVIKVLDNPIEGIIDINGNQFISVDEINGIKVLKNVRPDIIIHSRGIKENNLAVIEIKKDNYSVRNNGLAKHVDLAKLYAMTSQQDLNYKIGYYIEFPTGNNINSFNNAKIVRSAWVTDTFGSNHNVYEVYLDNIIK